MPRLVQKYFKAQKLRREGFSIREIAQKLKISKSTASLWVKEVKISKKGLQRIQKRKQMSRLKAKETKALKRQRMLEELRKEANNFLTKVQLDKNHFKILCAILLYCEGGKDAQAGISFINSDPALIKSFLFLLRNSFSLDERKFRAILHLHKYHSVRKQTLFWSKITKIPPSQFTKPYLKSNTGKRIKENYPGCLKIKYYDAALARQLLILAEEIFKKYS